MKKLIFGTLAVCLFSQMVQAESTPRRTAYDSRIRNVIYNPDNVTRVNVAAGVATLIQFHPNEFISDVEGGLGLGDAEAWAVNVKNNNIWLKPIAPEPDTNLVIVTNKRTYQFNLVSVKSRNSAYWSVRFTYPELQKAPTSPWVRPCQGGTYNYRYFAQGTEKDKSIFPMEVWDNGTFTCFKFPIGNDLPVIFKKLPDGKEGLVNSHVENGYVVVHEINNQYRIRLGDLVVGIKTDNLKARQAINGTTNGKTREVIDE
ncbi:TrbG/VirB9 family P-type conjugative transfer protein [Avibacterium paragallinarum]|uniref:TrbG/VirB9 family P-type conjugative transfer protein n=1 Tax=Avibacterium paragallinarum TaxID=728 RepID=A0ABU7QSD0_AVIPA|nr:TrbG/VirB9 family P-type conjugative transfer protein [Avibacterium paragallinarum]